MSTPVRLAFPSLGSGKLEAFEGIRGLASVGVLFAHLGIAFWPILYAPDHPELANYSRPVRFIVQSPLRVAYDGQFAVAIFFVLSGFVLSLSFFRRPDPAGIAAASARRYSRLMIPAAVSIFAGYLFMSCGWMFNQAASHKATETVGFPHGWLGLFYTFEPTARTALREAFWDAFFNGGGRYNQNLWTMSVELPGSFLVYAFVLLFGTLRHRYVFYIGGAVILLLSSKLFMLDFLVGVALADLFAANERLRRPLRIPGPIALAIAAAAFYVVSTKSVTGTYTFWGMASIPKSGVRELIGSVLVIGVTGYSRTLQWLLERRAISFLGRISFALYLVHLILICSLASYVYLKLNKRGFGHDWAAGLASLSCIAASFLTAWGMYHAVDKPVIRAGKWMYEMWFKPQRTVAPETTDIGASKAA